MWRERVFHACMGAVIVALALGSAVQVSKADVNELLRQATPGRTAQVVLPAIHTPRPYSQTMVVDCATEKPDHCIIRFDKIPDNRLLEIATINCASSSGSNLLLFKTGKFDQTLKTALVLMPTSLSRTLLSGPFYLNARNRPMIATEGAPGERAFCSIFGTLWRTD